jgi:metal-responsive CopG/Arc/MetJ family transcriptional regulator
MPTAHGRKSTSVKIVRRSVSIPQEIDKRVNSIARKQKSSTNRVLADLIGAGLEAREAEKKRFFEVAERLRSGTNPAEVEQLKNELAQMIFGE